MSGDASLFELAKHFGGHSHPVLFALDQNRHGVEVVLEGSAGAVLGVRNVVADVSYSRVLKGKLRHRVGILPQVLSLRTARNSLY